MTELNGDANEWRATPVSKNQIQVGDIIQWPNMGERGHVAIVEKVNSDHIVVSDSSYGQANSNTSWLHRVKAINNLNGARVLRVSGM